MTEPEPIKSTCQFVTTQGEKRNQVCGRRCRGKFCYRHKEETMKKHNEKQNAQRKKDKAPGSFALREYCENMNAVSRRCREISNGAPSRYGNVDENARRTLEAIAKNIDILLKKYFGSGVVSARPFGAACRTLRVRTTGVVGVVFPEERATAEQSEATVSEKRATVS